MSGTESPITDSSTNADPLNVLTGEETNEEAKAQAGAEVKAKTCVEPMDKVPTEDGDYVMFDGTKYTVFTIKDGAGLPVNVENAKFFKVLLDETKGGKRKSRKSAKKQRKSRGSRRSKK